MADGAGAASIGDLLLKERRALLDLSTRNRLLNTPLRTRNNRAIEIVDEKAAEVFRLLTAGKALTFLPGIQLTEEERAALDPEDNVTGGIPQPGDDALDDRGVAARHSDTRLQTRLTSEGLQKRLFDIWYDAETLEQEQGVNVLYLAIGLLRWFDTDTSDIARHAPLVLLPVKLERSSAAEKFRLKGRDEPPSPNLTLQAKMNAEFALTIEDFSNEDEVDLAAYCAKVAETVSGKARWEVLPDAMVLGFFSFSKFLMYRDLDPANWPQDGISTHPMIAGLLRDGFPQDAPLVPDNAAIDDAIPALELHHVVDADSSQTVAIAEAAGGRTLVVKGPPGTGKSQTITNIIAAAAARGKKVLFVAEKMAALDVVHRRLRQAGLGPLTLELHSNKVNKRTVLEELKRTRDAQHKPPRGDLSVIQKLGQTIGSLNSFARRLHGRLEPCGLTPQTILGRLARASRLDAPAGFQLDGADGWDRDAVAEREALVAEIAERLKDIGAVPHHVWRGVRRGPLDPVEREGVAAAIGQAATLLERVRDHASVAARNLDASATVNFGDVEAARAFLAVTPVPPTLDRPALASSSWVNGVDRLRALVAAGRHYADRWAAAESSFNETGREADYDSLRTTIVTRGAGLLRFLDGNYRAQVAVLRSYLSGALPKSQAERIALVDRMIAAQKARAAFAAAAADGAAFGAAWKGERSDWDALEAILNWRTGHDALPSGIWMRLAQLGDTSALDAARVGLAADLPELRTRLDGLFAGLDLDLQRAFGAASMSELPLAILAARLADWRADMEGLSRFTAFASRTGLLVQAGMQSLAEGIHDGRLDPGTLPLAFEAAYAETLRRMLFAAWPELRAFDGAAHNNVVSMFRQMDKARIELAQEQIAGAHAEGRPRGASGIGPLGFLNGEIAKKTRHAPLRVLLDKAGPAIQQLKPVFMMSPLSVAQFLKPGGLAFDLLVMDEASQIEPVDALGAIARVNQIVVVGDERQLPPTAFFRKLTGDENPGEDEDGAARAKDMESILELCLAKGVPHRMLSWHYRSKHQSLIAVSNREFYENKLFIVPSPYDAIAGMGLKFNLLKDAPYDRGGTRTNPAEARPWRRP